MSPGIGIAIGTPFGRKAGYKTILGALEDKFQFFWQEGSFDGNNLLDILNETDVITVTSKDFVTDYIPATSVATFDCPNNATYIACDTDYLWINRNAENRGVEVSELIGYDFARTFIKYDSASPHHIRWIGIAKSGAVFTADEYDTLHTLFELSLFWSGVLNVNGFVKANRGLIQSVWPVISIAALNYSDTYETAVIADGGIIVSRKILESEYQRLIDTGNILTCWFSYHWKCGIKKSLVNYGLGNVDMVYKWYNLSPVAGRFAESVYAYSIVLGTDARPEYTTLGLRFRTTNLDGGTRCGLESSATIITNLNNKIRVRGIVNSPLTTVYPCVAKGYNEVTGYLGILPNTTQKLITNYYGGGAPRQESTVGLFFTASVETEFSVTLDFTAETITILKNGAAYEVLNIAAYNPVYPAAAVQDFVGHGRGAGRNVHVGYIKQVEMFYL